MVNSNGRWLSDKLLGVSADMMTGEKFLVF
jgi:hypothetical protein